MEVGDRRGDGVQGGAEDAGEFHNFHVLVPGGAGKRVAAGPGDDGVDAGEICEEADEFRVRFHKDPGGVAAHHRRIAKKLNGVAEAVEAANHHPLAGERGTVPEGCAGG